MSDDKPTPDYAKPLESDPDARYVSGSIKGPWHNHGKPKPPKPAAKTPADPPKPTPKP